MINAWSLLYDEIYGTNKMTDKDKKDVDEDLLELTCSMKPSLRDSQ